jgi:hypothetical protein
MVTVTVSMGSIRHVAGTHIAHFIRRRPAAKKLA